jgi:hypothetical protein
MSRVLRYFAVYFQWLPIAIGDSMQHGRDMRIAWTPFTNIVSWPRENIVSTGTFSTGWRGTGKTFVAQITTKRGRGKPPMAARIRGDLIVAKVRELERTEHKMDLVIVPRVARLFGVDPKTVWNALKEDRKAGPTGPIRLGSMQPLTHTHTGSCLGNNYLQ